MANGEYFPDCRAQLDISRIQRVNEEVVASGVLQ